MSGHPKRWLACVVLGVLFVTPLAIWNYSAAKTTARWLLWSRDYKSRVLSQPSSSSGELKHIEWDAWGWATIDTTVYLVFDPTNSLSLAASTHISGKFAGIPCEVPNVSRLESQWYIVTFYTNQEWRNCN